MTSREACLHRIALISRELHASVMRLEGSLTEGVFSQLDRSTLSIGSNWCEAMGRTTRAQAKQFLGFARGSAYEAAFQFWCIGETELADLAHVVALAIDVEMDSVDVKKISLNDAFEMAERRSDSRFGQPVEAVRTNREASNTDGDSPDDAGRVVTPDRDPGSC